MKRIGIDFGTKKIGIAVSDESGQMAFPHEVVPNNKDFMSYIEKLIQSRQVEEVV
ncbi:Holliday junction resolvase RuvX, partial [Candidatus Kaiserbacteria bacterium]|nr:Holliday junction resolvase RuvX [Candidatus Kaiserbacteria bacterium]